MADHAQTDAGEMDLPAHVATYRTFNKLLHIGSLILAVGLSFFVPWLCAHLGFVPSLILAIVVAVVGSWMVFKPGAH